MPTPLHALLLLVTVFPRFLDTWDAAATARLEARFAAIRAAGDPVTMKELAERIPEPPDGQNAARFYEAALGQMEALDDALDALAELVPLVGEAELPLRGQPVPPVMLGAIERYLHAAEPVFEPLDKATALEHCKFKLDLTKGLAIELRHTSKMIQAQRLYALRAVLHAEKGEAAKAADMLVRGIATGEALRHEPILISALVRIACHYRAIEQLKRAANRIRFPQASLEVLSKRLDTAADPTLATGAMVGERCFGIAIYQTHVLNGEAGDILEMFGDGPRLGLMARLIPRAHFKSDMVAYIDAMNAYVDASRKPYPQSVLESARIGESLDETIPRCYVISRGLLPALGRICEMAQQYMAKNDTARVAIACLRHRARHGRLPETLDELAPAFLDSVPPDPFTGKALLYRKDTRGFVVYALGENGKDDGGDTDVPDVGKPPDVGFRVTFPKGEF